MTWTPNATVTINGVDFTGSSLNGVSINYGRTTIWNQARSTFASISILNSTNTDYGFEINDSVSVSIEDSDGTIITVFTGTITDVSNEVDASGSVKTTAIQNISAIGAFAAMSRVIVGTTNYPKEYDDVRIDRIFTEAGVTIDVVDTPGVYQLTSRTANPTDAYSLASYYAGMCFGYIYETTDGKVGYANESRRTLDVAASGYLNIPTNVINWRGINSRRSLADIVNRVILFYKNNDQTSAEDTHSITQYGLFEARIDTELEDASEATNIAERYVSLRSIPQTNFSSFNINLDNPNITNAVLDSLIGVYMGMAIQIEDLPVAISPVTYQGFVEGWNLTINRNQAFLTITSSDTAYSVVPIRWQDVDPLIAWDDVDPLAVKTTRTNAVLNPSIETGTTGWVGLNANYTVSQYTTDAYSGTASLRVNCLAATGNFGGAITSRTTTPAQRIPIANGQTWTVQAYFKRLIGTRNNRIEIRTYSTSNSTIVIESFSGNSISPTSWAQSTLTATFTNASSLWMEIRLVHSTTGAANDAFLTDAIMATQQSSNTFYWDGTNTDIPANRNYTLAWTGTANASTSTANAYFGTIPDTTWQNVDEVGLP